MNITAFTAIQAWWADTASVGGVSHRWGLFLEQEAQRAETAITKTSSILVSALWACRSL